MLTYAIAAGLGGLVTAGYNTMAPRSQLYGRTFLGEGRGSRRLALTFDDGPNDPHTLALLELLTRHNVRATFFMLGRFAVQRPEIVREVARAGHAIGNHTFSHPNLIFCTRAEMETQICECEKAIAEVLGEEFPGFAVRRPRAEQESTRSFDSRGQKPAAVAQDDTVNRLKLFRPPHGGRRPNVLRTVRRLGYVPVMWSVTGWDWNATSAEAIERSITRQVSGGDVILLHDGGHLRLGADRSHTVMAVDHLIARYRSEGYEFVTVPEMMN